MAKEALNYNRLTKEEVAAMSEAELAAKFAEDIAALKAFYGKLELSPVCDESSDLGGVYDLRVSIVSAFSGDEYEVVGQ